MLSEKIDDTEEGPIWEKIREDEKFSDDKEEGGGVGEDTEEEECGDAGEDNEEEEDEDAGEDNVGEEGGAGDEDNDEEELGDVVEDNEDEDADNAGEDNKEEEGDDAGFSFVYSLLACDLWRSWRDYVQSSSCPVSAQWRHVASTPLPSAQACPKETWSAPRKVQRKRTNEKDKFTGLALSGGRHEVRLGKKQWWSLPVRLLSARSLLLHPLPHLKHEHHAHSVILLPRRPPPHIRGREED